MEDDGSVCPECHGDDTCTCTSEQDDWTCCECDEELREDGSCSNEECAEYYEEEL